MNMERWCSLIYNSGYGQDINIERWCSVIYKSSRSHCWLCGLKHVRSTNCSAVGLNLDLVKVIIKLILCYIQRLGDLCLAHYTTCFSMVGLVS